MPARGIGESLDRLDNIPTTPHRGHDKDHDFYHRAAWDKSTMHTADVYFLHFLFGTAAACRSGRDSGDLAVATARIGICYQSIS